MSLTVCVVCRHRDLPDGRPMVCVPCESWTGRRLDELARTWPLLLARHDSLVRVGSGASLGAPIAGSREAPVPLDLTHLDVTGPIHPEALTVPSGPDQIGHLAVATELDFWVRDWARELGITALPEPEIAAMSAWLRIHLPEACASHHAIDEFAAAINRIATVVAKRADELDDRLVIGRCPVIADDRECGGTLRADPWLDIIECPRCTTRWHRNHWLILARAIRRDQE